MPYIAVRAYTSKLPLQ